ncbi:MAG TPA: AbrB family transcriptional regulator [Caulobacteraceae bacterium]|nr:AbrB family transcriptional regulator [Caulobacteraceae bacterium]
MTGPSAADRLLQPLPSAGRWAVLLAASVLAAGLLLWARLPAALLLGPLAAAVLVQTAGGVVKVPRPAAAAAQAVVGCLIARSITPAIVGGFASHWPVFLAVVAISIGASAGIGWIMSRLRIVSGTTAVWGMLPGAATAMMVMAEAYGADFRLVAFMQYLRVVLVAAGASVVALLFVHGGVASRFAGGYFPPIHLQDLAATAGVAVIGGGLGLASRIPAGVLLGPLALGAALNIAGLVRIELPPVVLIASYAAIGWNTGLRFTRDVLAAAARALPQSLGATALLMAFCGLLAWMLVVLLHIDPLTAYLATSPGGVDAAAIIAASTKVDTPFVMALQTLRVVVVLAIGPPVARWVAGTLNPAAAHTDPSEPANPGDRD